MKKARGLGEEICRRIREMALGRALLVGADRVYLFTGQTLVVAGMQMASRDESLVFVSMSMVGSGLVDSQFTM